VANKSLWLKKDFAEIDNLLACDGGGLVLIEIYPAINNKAFYVL
jgi:hypothetical protein